MQPSAELKSDRVRAAVDDRYDTIVVGAGIGGLMAGALLARHGLRVLVLDQHYQPGGCTTSFKRRGWEFDVGLHYIGECRPNENIPCMLRACGVDDIEFLPMDRDLDIARFPDFEFAFPGDHAELERRLLSRFPGEHRGIRRYLRLLRQLSRISRAEATRSKLAFAAAIGRSPLAAWWAFRTAREFADTCTADPRLRAIMLLQNGAHAVAPRRVSAALHFGLQNHYLRSGGWYPRGGGRHLSSRLSEELERAGGHLRLRATVREILVEQGRAVGVRFFNKHLGERTVRADCVISNADIKRTIFELAGAEHFPARVVERARTFEMSLPLFVVFLGLDFPPDDLPFGNSNIWIHDRLDVDPDYEMLARGQMPEAPFVYVATTSRKDPHNRSVAPPGHTNLQLMTVVPRDPVFWGVTPAAIANGTYRKSERYLAVKAALEQACIVQAHRIIPDLDAHIVHQESSTPMTTRRYISTSDGASYGLAGTPAQFLSNRPTADSGLPGLYFCGGSCRSGHGIMGAMGSAFTAAAAVAGRGANIKLAPPLLADAGRDAQRLGHRKPVLATTTAGSLDR